MVGLFVGVPLMVLGLLLTTLTGESAAQQQFSVDFTKAPGGTRSCLTPESDNGGFYLRCPIQLPAGVPDGVFVRSVVFTCLPSDSPSCMATFECGSSGNCGRHPNPIEPVAYNLQNLRSVTWWGWTGNPAEATLRFEVIVGP